MVTKLKVVKVKDIGAGLSLLSPQDGDIIAVKLAPTTSFSRVPIMEACRQLEEKSKHKITVVLIPDNLGLEMVPYDQFKKLAERVAAQRGVTVTFSEGKDNE
jgi:hypothetical protein